MSVLLSRASNRAVEQPDEADERYTLRYNLRSALTVKEGDTIVIAGDAPPAIPLGLLHVGVPEHQLDRPEVDAGGQKPAGAFVTTVMPVVRGAASSMMTSVPDFSQ